MKKRVMLASLLALALAVSPLGGMGMRVSAEEGAPTEAEIRTVSGGNNSELEDRKLPTPTNPRWEDNLFVAFDYDGRQPQNWKVEIERNFYFYDGFYVDVLPGNPIPWNGLYLRDDNTDGSDTYYLPESTIADELVWDGMSLRFRVRAMDGTWDDAVNNSEWSEWSESWIWKDPVQKLGDVYGYWDTEKLGLFHYTTVENAAGYGWMVEKWNDDQNKWQTCSCIHDGSRTWVNLAYNFVEYFDWVELSSARESGGEIRDMDCSWTIGRYGEGKYRVRMQALSNNINEIGNGDLFPRNEEDCCILDTVTGIVTDGPQSRPNTDSNEGGSSSTNQGSSNGTSSLDNQIAAAVSGTTIKITKDQNISTLSNSTMQQLLKRGDVALEMEYTYNGEDYHIYIPAGAAMDNDVPWYGPLYLAQYYRVYDAQAAEYVVRRGDTFSKIARANGMTTAQLAAKNPQIKNISFIYPGQIIYIK